MDSNAIGNDRIQRLEGLLPLCKSRELKDRCDANARFELLCDNSAYFSRCLALLHHQKFNKIYLRNPVRRIVQFAVPCSISGSFLSVFDWIQFL